MQSSTQNVMQLKLLASCACACCRQRQATQAAIDPEERTRLTGELRKAEESAASLQGQCRSLQQQVCHWPCSLSMLHLAQQFAACLQASIAACSSRIASCSLAL